MIEVSLEEEEEEGAAAAQRKTIGGGRAAKRTFEERRRYQHRCRDRDKQTGAIDSANVGSVLRGGVVA